MPVRRVAMTGPWLLVALFALTGCPAVVVETESGAVAGLRMHSPHGPFEVFKGIPYAAPPIGELRWRPPEPAEPWHGILPAFEPPPPCLQDSGWLSFVSVVPPSPEPCEDCLYLNVWRPANAGHEPLPIMVWIPGGGFQGGTGDFPLYDGAPLNAEGVILVTVNFRVGTLGFLAHPALSAESPEGISGNYGMLDKIAALEWVQRNAAAFGGDPDNVTLFGISSGAMGIGALLATPMAEGLFHKAIIQGGPTWPLPPLRSDNPATASAEAIGQQTAAKLGINGNGPAAAAALRALPPDELLDATNDSDLFNLRLGDNPTVDGVIISGQPLLMLQAGEVNPVPLLIGANEDEASVYTVISDHFDQWGPADYEDFVLEFFAGDAHAILAEYPVSDPIMPTLNRLVTDFAFVVPTRLYAHAAASHGAPVYRYHFTQRPGNIVGDIFGAHHAAEVPFVFDTLIGRSARDPGDRALAAAIRRYWTRFAKTGDPNGPGDPHWPQDTPATDTHLELGPQIRPGQHLRHDEAALLTPILQQYYEGAR